MSFFLSLFEGTTFGIAAVGVAYVGMKFYFSSYLTKKGENLATKEDIQEITKKIESVKHDYAKQLESTKAELTSRINTSSFRYQKEYELLEILSKQIIALKELCLKIPPERKSYEHHVYDITPKSDEYNQFMDFLTTLESSYEEKQAFFSKSVYLSTLKLFSTASSVAHTLATEDVPKKNNRISNPHDDTINIVSLREQNARSDIQKACKAVLEAIRLRIEEWEFVTVEKD